jgi:hypothetical protein
VEQSYLGTVISVPGTCYVVVEFSKRCIEAAEGTMLQAICLSRGYDPRSEVSL